MSLFQVACTKDPALTLPRADHTDQRHGQRGAPRAFSHTLTELCGPVQSGAPIDGSYVRYAVSVRSWPR